ncbi:MAG: bifunctional diguanylate cyclase/phosphodiesterase [Vicinamibacteria bacterium]|nr:bifunctional diguanylate cyclase/phosphodiesterase [Vicinamibacteria bacterium]
MPVSSAYSTLDLLGSISTATGTAIALGATRIDSAPGFRSFAGAWAAIAVHLLARPAAAAGEPGWLVLDVLSGATAGAFLIHGASAWEPERARRRAGSAVAYAVFALSCAIQSTLVVVGGPDGDSIAIFRTLRLFVVTALAFHFTRAARHGESVSARVLSWAFGALAALSAVSPLAEDLRPGGALATLLLNSAAAMVWMALALSMAGCLLEERTHRRASRARSESDDVTGLSLRAPFEQQLDAALARARLQGEGLALAFLDLDRFRTLNESMGHGAGDAVLLEVADRMRRTLPQGALAARVGGDEFVAVWPGVSDSTEALRLAGELSSSLAAPMYVNGQEVLISATAGVSLFPKDAGDAATLLDHAHAAAYRTKERSPGQPRLYNADMTGRSRRELSMEMRLRRALSLNELWVYYQPRLSLTTGRIDGFEALVRWLHPSEGLLAAAAFIDLAESTGLVVPIGRFVLRRACQDAQEARALTSADFTVAVNLSAQQLADPQIVDDVRRALRETGLPAKALEIEVTETAAMYDIGQTRGVLERLREMGVSVALDDFGTGHSALGYLKELPVDRLKIDKCFVRDLVSDAKDRFLLRAVIALGRARGLQVTAEGVEDPRQLRFLAAAGCHHVQGYLIGTARPALELARLAGQAPEGISVRLPRRRKSRLRLVAG